jgi:DNA-binding transcriptional LysR family regulator
MPAHLDIDLLRSFAVIAETGVLSRAAERVGRTQAAISMQVKRLEEAIGQPLLIRTGRGVVLTRHGERLLAHAQKILRSHDEAVAELSGENLSGILRFGCPDDYAMAFLPPVLRGFARLHPQVLIEVVCAPTPRLLDRLKNHALDVALISLPDDGPEDQIMRREPLVWVRCKGGDASERAPLQLALSDPDTLDHQAAKASLERAGRSYRVAYASGSLAGLTAVVRSGQAVAVLTQTAVPADLQILPATSGLPPLPGVGIALKVDGRRSSTLLQAFDAHVRSVLPAL